MRIILGFFFLSIFISTSAQIVTASLEESSPYLIYQTNIWSRERTGFQSGEFVIQINRSGYRPGTLITRLDQISFSLEIRKINQEGKIVAEYSPENGRRVFGPFNIFPIKFGSRILFFYFKYEDEFMRVFVSEVEQNSLQLINTKELYSYQQGNAGILRTFGIMDRDIMIRQSNDQTSLLFATRDNKSEVFSCVLDSGLTILRKSRYNSPEIRNLTITDMCLDNDGNSLMAFSKTHFPISALVEPKNRTEERYGRTEIKMILTQTADNTNWVTNVDSWGIGVLYNARFYASKLKNLVYIYGDYPGPSGPTGTSGVWLTEVESGKASTPKPKQYPYPNDLKLAVYKMSYGSKNKGAIGILPTGFEMTELENGDLVLGGSPILYVRGERTTASYAGPIIISFLNNHREPVFTAIPRSQLYSSGSRPIFVPFEDNLVIVYTEEANSFNDPDPKNNLLRNPRPPELSIGAAVVNKHGEILSRKVLVEPFSKSNFFNTSDYELLSANKIRILPALIEKKDLNTRAVVISIE